MSQPEVGYSAEFSSAVQAPMIALARRGGPWEAGGLDENESYLFDTTSTTYATMLMHGKPAATYHTMLSLTAKRASEVNPTTDLIDTLSRLVGAEIASDYSHIRHVDTWRYCISEARGARLRRSTSTTVYGSFGATGKALTKLTTIPMDASPWYQDVHNQEVLTEHKPEEQTARSYAFLRWRRQRRREKSLLDRAREQSDLSKRLIPAFLALGLESTGLMSLLDIDVDADYER